MIEFLTKETLRVNVYFVNVTQTFLEAQKDMFLDMRKYEKVSVFFCYNHLTDQQSFRQAIALLKSLKYSIFVDWLDEEIIDYSNHGTLHEIKRKIRENDRFIFLATNEALNFKWCSWQLGFADSTKNSDYSLAILPLADTTSADWQGVSFLGTYPVILPKFNEHGKIIDLMVKLPNEKEINLNTWLLK